MYKSSIFIVVILIVLSGCIGVDNGSTPPASTPTDTALPSETPTNGGELAPGITSAGIVNPVALMTAHQRALLDSGFVVNQTVASTYDGQPSNRLALQTIVGPRGDIAYQSAVSSGFTHEGEVSVITNDLWLNTTTQISRHVEDGTATYDVQPRLYPPESLVWFGSLQRDIQFAAGDYEVTNVEQRAGSVVVTLEASIDRVGNDGIIDTTSTLLVEATGMIRHAETTVSYEEGQQYATTYDISSLGQSAPTPPDWLDAVPPSASLDIGLDVFEFTATSIELVHLHGDAVPAGSILSVISNGTLYEVTLDTLFNDGRRYLSITADGTLQATVEPPEPSTVQSLAQEVTVQVHASDGAELFSVSIGRR